MFLGEDRHNLDGKGRVVIPARFRSQLEAQGCVVAKGQDGHLMVFPSSVYEQTIAERARSRPDDVDGRAFRRTLFGGADQQVPDSSGRLLIRADLKKFANLDTEVPVALVGVYDHIELWNAEIYDDVVAAGDAAYLDTDRDREEDEDRE